MNPPYPRSDHFDGERFFNPNGHNPRGFRDLLKWQFSRTQGLWPAWVENTAQPALPATLAPRACAVTFVGHDTFLLQFDGLNVLTDPIWSDRCSPVSWAGPKRVRAPGLAFEALPRIDLVLVSHNHYDHLDLPTLKRLHAAHRPVLLTPLGNKPFLAGEGIDTAVELDWWQSHEVKPGVKVTVTPAQHFAARGMSDRFMTLWGGFALETLAGKIWFAGDSGYFDGFKAIGEKLGPFDLALIPIGAYEPRWFMEPVHCTPAEAIQIHRDVRARRSLAMHFGCFPLADDGFAQPVTEFRAAFAASQLGAEDFVVPEVGETRILSFA
ncbi:MBL fold metallo-hydrolase [Oleiharenicola lentus]|uniref:MBL fold metallo-hydrolase n=2 Tax=Oleiharenicola lentus TaxID=2508720 RepID=A0A4V1M6X1_9BACT|nr:MBL fold metallo-hydrolase [Oleiharenicola lentus]